MTLENVHFKHTLKVFCFVFVVFFLLQDSLEIIFMVQISKTDVVNHVAFSNLI